MENNYYVYEWVRLYTNETIYVCKGKEDRAYEMKYGRNKYFKDIIKNRDVAVVILIDNLTEEEAFQYECWYINEFRYEWGMTLTNRTDGGEGVSGWFNSLSDEDKEAYSENMTQILKERYKNNPELKSRVTEKLVEYMKSDKQRAISRELGKQRHKEEPDFYKNISIKFWRSSEGRAKASIQGKNIWRNPETRSKILNSRKVSERWKSAIKVRAEKFVGGGNPNSKKITLNINGELYKFSCKKDAIDYLNKINIQLVSDRTGKTVKRVTNALFNKKLSKNIYQDYRGNLINIE